MKKGNLYFFVGLLLLIWSCDGEEEPIPAYLYIKPFDVSVNNNQGSAASKITDVWLSPEQEGFLGAYELPALIPILAEGSTKLLLDPGIKENGISSTPGIYPFLERYEVTVDLVPGQTDTIQPTTQYDNEPLVEFPLVESFDNNNILTIYLDTTSNALVSTTGTNAFEGKSAKFTVDETNSSIQVASVQRMRLPKEGRTVFLEMHYKNDALLEVGLVGYRDGSNTPIKSFFIALNPRSDWNKIYINLTDELIASAADINEFQILLGARLQDGDASATYLIDNLKVLHFEN